MNERGRFSVPMAFATAGGGGDERGRVRQEGNLPEKVENHCPNPRGPVGPPPLFGLRCRLFNIGPKVEPPPGPPLSFCL